MRRSRGKISGRGLGGLVVVVRRGYQKWPRMDACLGSRETDDLCFCIIDDEDEDGERSENDNDCLLLCTNLSEYKTTKINSIA